MFLAEVFSGGFGLVTNLYAAEVFRDHFRISCIVLEIAQNSVKYLIIVLFFFGFCGSFLVCTVIGTEENFFVFWNRRRATGFFGS